VFHALHADAIPGKSAVQATYERGAQIQRKEAVHRQHMREEHKYRERRLSTSRTNTEKGGCLPHKYRERRLQRGHIVLQKGPYCAAKGCLPHVDELK
jgi:hypothetical protein